MANNRHGNRICFDEPSDLLPRFLDRRVRGWLVHATTGDAR